MKTILRLKITFIFFLTATNPAFSLPVSRFVIKKYNLGAHGNAVYSLIKKNIKHFDPREMDSSINHFFMMTTMPGIETKVAVDEDSNVIGFVNYYIIEKIILPPEGSINLLAISSKFQSNGAAKALIEAARADMTQTSAIKYENGAFWPSIAYLTATSVLTSQLDKFYEKNGLSVYGYYRNQGYAHHSETIFPALAQLALIAKIKLGSILNRK